MVVDGDRDDYRPSTGQRRADALGARLLDPGPFAPGQQCVGDERQTGLCGRHEDDLAWLGAYPTKLGEMLA